MSSRKIHILHIETTTTVCSVAVSEKNQLLAIREVNEPNIHASALTLFVEQVMEEAGLKLDELSGVVVSKGPGSYTGLRIGVSVAKGLCYALDIPLIAVDTLQAMALSFVQHNKSRSKSVLYCPMIDARRMEVFTAFYGVDMNNVSPTQALVVDEDTFEEYVQQWEKVVLFGTGADKFVELFSDEGRIEVQGGFQNSAAYLVEEAYRKYIAGELEDLVYFEPFYLKDFVATTPKKIL